MPGLQENRLEGRLRQAGMKPLRQRPGLQPDARQWQAKSLQERNKGVGVAFDLHLFHDLARCVDNTTARQFQRHVDSCIV